MKSPDRFLIVIVVGIVTLMLVGLGVAFFQGGPTYRTEDTAENIAYNYLFAIYLDEDERAFGYLAPESHAYEDVAEFRSVIRRELGLYSSGDDSFGIEILKNTPTDTGVTVEARVNIYNRYTNYPFWWSESSYVNTTDVALKVVQNEAGVWQIANTSAD